MKWFTYHILVFVSCPFHSAAGGRLHVMLSDVAVFGTISWEGGGEEGFSADVKSDLWTDDGEAPVIKGHTGFNKLIPSCLV